MVSKKKTTDIHSIRARKLVCKNTRFEVFLDDIESSDGTVVHDYLAVVPRIRTVNGVAGIAVLPIIDNKIDYSEYSDIPLQHTAGDPARFCRSWGNRCCFRTT